MAWPTTNDPRTEFVTVRFTRSEADDIDWLISQTGARSRSAAVRDAVDRVVTVEQRRARKQKGPSTPVEDGPVEGGPVEDGGDG